MQNELVTTNPASSSEDLVAFELLNNSGQPSYYVGDAVICRQVPEKEWVLKIKMNETDFIIDHFTQGLMLREIIDHDTETGLITCQSINNDQVTPAKSQIYLNYILGLYEIEEVRQSGISVKSRRV